VPQTKLSFGWLKLDTEKLDEKIKALKGACCAASPLCFSPRLFSSAVGGRASVFGDVF
jgi:hypothetical protein